MPSNNTSPVFFYTYILQRLRDDNHYIGWTNNLKNRIEEHQNGRSLATKPRLSLKLIYYEACLNELDAKQREKYLKSTAGRRFLAKRLKNSKAINSLTFVK